VETKNRWGFKCLEFYWGREINDYSQFPSWIFYFILCIYQLR